MFCCYGCYWCCEIVGAVVVIGTTVVDSDKVVDTAIVVVSCAVSFGAAVVVGYQKFMTAEQKKLDEYTACL